MDLYNPIEASRLEIIAERFGLTSSPQKSYSQAFQDLMLWIIFDGKHGGSFLEIGCNHPKYTNNTFLLSAERGWRGVSFDILDVSREWELQRPEDSFICADVLATDIVNLVARCRKTPHGYFDYLQIDIDPCENSYSCLCKIDHQIQRFGVITFETDQYTGFSGVQVTGKSREFFKNLGYEPLLMDVLVDGDKPYEDWWYCPFSLTQNELDRAAIFRECSEQMKTSDPRRIILGENQ
jgi:hypothetical protein